MEKKIDEIKSTGAIIQKWIDEFKETSLLKNPKLVRFSLIFRDDDGQIEERAFSHHTFDYERDMK